MVTAFRDLVARGGAEGWQYHLVGGCAPEHQPYLDQIRAVADGLPVFLHPDASGAELGDLYARASIFWHAAGPRRGPRAPPRPLRALRHHHRRGHVGRRSARRDRRRRAGRDRRARRDGLPLRRPRRPGGPHRAADRRPRVAGGPVGRRPSVGLTTSGGSRSPPRCTPRSRRSADMIGACPPPPTRRTRSRPPLGGWLGPFAPRPRRAGRSAGRLARMPAARAAGARARQREPAPPRAVRGVGSEWALLLAVPRPRRLRAPGRRGCATPTASCRASTCARTSSSPCSRSSPTCSTRRGRRRGRRPPRARGPARRPALLARQPRLRPRRRHRAPRHAPPRAAPPDRRGGLGLLVGADPRHRRAAPPRPPRSPSSSRTPPSSRACCAPTTSGGSRSTALPVQDVDPVGVHPLRAPATCCSSTRPTS